MAMQAVIVTGNHGEQVFTASDNWELFQLVMAGNSAPLDKELKSAIDSAIASVYTGKKVYDTYLVNQRVGFAGF